ncbi:MAG: CpaD family pilus assembly protein [Hyphomicrobiaceae bacterium]
MFVSKYVPKTAGRLTSPLSVSVTAALIVVSGLAGCTGHRAQYAEVRGTEIADPSARHPIMVSKAPVQMDIEVPRGSSGLTRSQSSELKAFVSRYRSEGEGQLIVSAPSGGNNEYAIVNAVSKVRDVIHGSGISGHAVSMEPYYVNGDANAPVKISFTTFVANGPECGQWKKNIGESLGNKNYGNFGCTQQKNMAAMVDNARDLVHPRGLDPRSSQRRDALYDKWIAGESTGAEKSEDERAGTISDVAN